MEGEGLNRRELKALFEDEKAVEGKSSNIEVRAWTGEQLSWKQIRSRHSIVNKIEKKKAVRKAEQTHRTSSTTILTSLIDQQKHRPTHEPGGEIFNTASSFKW